MKVKALTLLEVLITLAIIGIILLIALPNFTGLIGQAHAVEAQQQLKTLYTFEKNYHYSHAEYSDDFTKVRYIPNKTVLDGGNAKYRIEVIESSSNQFKARATAVKDFDGDGVFNVWEIDQDQNMQEVVPD